MSYEKRLESVPDGTTGVVFSCKMIDPREIAFLDEATRRAMLENRLWFMLDGEGDSAMELLFNHFDVMDSLFATNLFVRRSEDNSGQSEVLVWISFSSREEMMKYRLALPSDIVPID